jgi:hypothetical protein
MRIHRQNTILKMRMVMNWDPSIWILGEDHNMILKTKVTTKTSWNTKRLFQRGRMIMHQKQKKFACHPCELFEYLPSVELWRVTWMPHNPWNIHQMNRLQLSWPTIWIPLMNFIVTIQSSMPSSGTHTIFRGPIWWDHDILLYIIHLPDTSGMESGTRTNSRWWWEFWSSTVLLDACHPGWHATRGRGFGGGGYWRKHPQYPQTQGTTSHPLPRWQDRGK